MKKKQVLGLVVAAIIFVLVGISSVFTNKVSESMFEKTASTLLTGGAEFSAPLSDYIAVVRVEGTIAQQTESSVWMPTSGYQHTTTMEYLDNLMADSRNVGILLYVDSPGGAVYESAELYDKLLEYKEATKRPIWGYMGHMAASGGYMASVATDKIYANQNTTTGSIGVIMAGVETVGLYEKLGMRYVSITSGKNKDGSRLSDEQIAIYQTQIDECFQDFVSKVATGRSMSEEEVLKLADGRTYTAKQAADNGLIDEIAAYEDVKALMSDELGTDTYYEPTSNLSGLASLLSEVKSLVPKSEAQVLLEEAKALESGVPMYYAE
ncbi:signal peptide peptidase SppA [Ohessyouella blattaphilus]|uniref:Signal peptide peptidase SppA n=1 Tax=Ohessyouella blattaphilus TaxID=2949333 RepID=A0ABT1EDH9_9FIRM|nr:signal peptide peptidase SppA [Ohessyouella blattaphilus]MCP1108740.1 signal peptide peptidase SppA [Ohessyouella blattaphilus]MCR8562134.1 signal peptide peptidase SppA [Ohessyouella blattaphilus]